MSRPQHERNGLKLPRSLQEEIGQDVRKPGDDLSRSKRKESLGRKEKRKADRQDKKALRAQSRGRVIDRAHVQNQNRSSKNPIPARTKDRRPDLEKPRHGSSATQQPKSILKKPSKPRLPSPDDSTFSDDHPPSDRSQSPGLVLDPNSKAFKDRVAQEDAEIATLEKRLGIKNKKAPKIFGDGLDDLLGGLDEYIDDDSPRKRKRDAEEWLSGKRRKASKVDDSESDEDEGRSLSATESDLDGDSDQYMDAIGTQSSEESEAGEHEDDFEEFESEDETAIQPQSKRENPYIPPVPQASTSNPPKYVPPSLRRQADPTDESTSRLRRQLQGHINRLSEANILSIVNEIEKLYQMNPRQSVTSVLIELILAPFCEPSQVQNTFVILHAAFISAVYKVIGTDFGAQVVADFIERFQRFHVENEQQSSKEAVNLISLLSYLYTFNVVSSVLIFDYVRLFLSVLTETNTELLLRVIRDCGPQLRQDDPSSLKDIVLIMQTTVAQTQQENRHVSVRTKFMIETITDLKNNKLRSGAAGTTAAMEHITRMRKAIGSLSNSRTVKATEPLRIGLEDIKNSDKRGKWWLVGASWKEHDTPNDVQDEIETERSEVMEDTDGTDLVALAAQHRMNTSVRRSIFIAIMSASDFRDAQLRLSRLRLKKAQELEIPRVLLHCSGSEAVYNPYYTLIAKQLSSDNKRMRMAFQFSLWGFFRRLGERDDGDDLEEDETVELKEVVNLGKMYGHLMADGTFPLDMLKTLNLVYLKEQTRVFVEVLLITIITRSAARTSNGLNQQSLAPIFATARGNPALSKGVQHFIRKILSKTDLVSSRKELKSVKSASSTIIRILESARNTTTEMMEENEMDGDLL